MCDTDRSILERRPEPGLAFDKRMLGLDLLSNYRAKHNRAADPTVSGPPGLRRPSDPFDGAVLALQRIFLLGQFLACQYLGVDLTQMWRESGGRLVKRAADDLGRGEDPIGKAQLRHIRKESVRDGQITHLSIEYCDPGRHLPDKWQ
jgi:hypothetical protein